MAAEGQTQESLIEEIARLREKIAGLNAALDAFVDADGGVFWGKVLPQSVLDAVGDPIMVIDEKYRVQMMNQAAREFSSGDSPASQPIRCYQVSHHRDTPCDGIEHPCPLEQVRATGQTVTVIHEHYMANGEKRFLEIVAVPYWDINKTMQGIVESMRDVTERIRAEQQLKYHVDRLRALAARFTEVSEVERKRLARDLHDLVGQNLSALSINLNIIQTQLSSTALGLVGARIEDSLTMVEETTERIRDVMVQLRPPILDDCGLIAALQWYGEKFTKRTGIPVTVEGFEPDPKLEAQVENTVFRITQEAMTNIAKHAQASRVTLRVEDQKNNLRFVIADDGIGFIPTPILELDDTHGWGLLTMVERAEALGGQCRIESASNQGTKVIVEIPR